MRNRPLLKLKLADAEDLARIEAVRANAPRAYLIGGANEGWTIEGLRAILPELYWLKAEMIEQPLPADKDEVLADIRLLFPLCADESCHDRTGLLAIKGRYPAVNIQLDKTGEWPRLLRTPPRPRGLRSM